MEHISPEKLSRLGEEKWQNMSPEQLAEALRQMDESVGEQEAEKAIGRNSLRSISSLQKYRKTYIPIWSGMIFQTV